jgi:hypothetical protein
MTQLCTDPDKRYKLCMGGCESGCRRKRGVLMPRSPWVTDGRMPCNRKLVIAEYSGAWPGRSGGCGIADIYADQGEWFNIPETVRIVRWMTIPE